MPSLASLPRPGNPDSPTLQQVLSNCAKLRAEMRNVVTSIEQQYESYLQTLHYHYQSDGSPVQYEHLTSLNEQGQGLTLACEQLLTTHARLINEVIKLEDGLPAGTKDYLNRNGSILFPNTVSAGAQFYVKKSGDSYLVEQLGSGQTETVLTQDADRLLSARELQAKPLVAKSLKAFTE